MFQCPEREESSLNIYIDTCVLPRSRLGTARLYREHFSPFLGFELLMMFDLPDFEDSLRNNLDLFTGVPLMFHEPVWGVEHSAPKGSAAYEEGMYHLRLTAKYAEILHPASMVCHLNNGTVPPGGREEMLRTSLENLEELREMFPGVELLVENTGILADGTALLDQDAFTGLCRERDFRTLIDVGHANANGWDLPKLLQDLEGRIGGFHLHNNDGSRDLHNRLRDGTLDFMRLVPYMLRYAPDVPYVIEYSRPAFHGLPLLEDIAFLQRISRRTEGGGEIKC